MWLATTKEHHASLCRELPNLRSIRALGKSVTGWQVLPADASGSFLIIKLKTSIGNDEGYGAGMPFGSWGDVCPEAIAAVSQWIEAGAPNN